METEFTPIASLTGGALIGIATIVLFFANGRIAGISGILSSVLPPKPNTKLMFESLAFLLGLIVAFPLYVLATNSTPDQSISSNTLLIAAGGLLVGLGSAIGGGCTSGHGVCGLSRLSPRSVIATLVFMFTAAVTVFVLRHVVGG